MSAGAAEHLVEVHDMFRAELTQLRELLEKVRDGAMSAGDARTKLNEMTLRQNDWTLGAVCARYCVGVTSHHTLEDEGIFPHLAGKDPALQPVLDRLGSEHVEIHHAIEAVDRELVAHMSDAGGYERLQEAVDLLANALLEHFEFEERELAEPLTKFGFY